MAVRYFLVPIVNSVGGVRQSGEMGGPKYFLNWRFGQSAGGTLTSPWKMMDYGIMPTGLLASDISAADLTFLQAQADVTVIPANIDNNVTQGALAGVRSALEALWLPGNWVTTGTTYRTVLRVVAGLMQFAQRYTALTGGDPLMTGAPNLDLTLGSLSQARRDALQATADSLGYSTSSFTLTTTLRVVLRTLGEAWGASPFIFGSITTL